eukprot:283100_1
MTSTGQKRCSTANLFVILLLSLICIGGLLLWVDETAASKLISKMVVSVQSSNNNSYNTINITRIEHEFNELLTKNNELEQSLINKSLEIRNIKAQFSKSFPQATSNKDKIDSSKWRNCFISNESESIVRLKYDDASHGELMNKLTQKYIATNKLKIFTLHFMRYANLYGVKCGIPMQSFHVAREYYFVNDQFYHREHNRNNTHVDFCVFYDYRALYEHIYDTYKDDDTTEWAIILEDDVTLCPLWINVTLNVLDEGWVYQKYGYSANKTIDLVYYGHGSTGTLLRISVLPFVFEIMDGYVERQTRLMANGPWHNTWDHYLPKWCKSNSKWARCVSSSTTVLFHPAEKRIKSTFDHNYPKNVRCDERNAWSDRSMKPLVLSSDHQR